MTARRTDGPRLLLIDIETFPIEMYAWRAWDTSALRIKEDTSLCSFSAAWLDGEHVTMALPDFKGYRAGGRDDKKLMAALWTLLDEADQVAAHNGDRFDVKKINYRFMVHGMKPPSPYKTIDTLKEVKKVASFDSHKLNELCRVLKIGAKVRTGGADLWFDCLAGDMKAWARMKKYNAHDVRLLKLLYLELRPWMKNHPNHALYTGITSCPKCGSTKMQRRGSERTAARTYQRLQCQACGGWMRGTEPMDDKLSLVNAR